MLGAPELIVVLVIVLVLFGGAKLPKLAKSLGEAQREFRKGSDDGDPTTANNTVTPTPPAAATPPAATEANPPSV
jgi:sec-independent protein translocase protein TatA